MGEGNRNERGVKVQLASKERSITSGSRFMCKGNFVASSPNPQPSLLLVVVLLKASATHGYTGIQSPSSGAVNWVVQASDSV